MHFSKLLMATMVGAASAAPAPIGGLIGGITGSTTKSTTDVTGSVSGRAVVTYMDAPQVVGAINAIADLSVKARGTIQGLDVTPLTIILHPDVIATIGQQFVGIATLVQADISAMATSPIGALAVEGQAQVCTTFKTFVKIHQDLLNVVIGKTGLIQSLGGAPIAAALRGLETVVDTIAIELINAVPTCANVDGGLKSDAAALKVTISAAICAYTPAGPAQDVLSSIGGLLNLPASTIDVCPTLLKVFSI